MKNINTILVVEDNQDHLVAAKAFFSTITDFKFVFAPNRKNAEELICTVDGLIISKNILFDENCERESYPSHEDAKLISIYAKGKGLPVLLLADYSRLGLGVVNTCFGTGFIDAKYIADKYFGKKMIDSIDSTGFNKFLHKNNIRVISYKWQKESIVKTSLETWKIIWEEFSRQFYTKTQSTHKAICRVNNTTKRQEHA